MWIPDPARSILPGTGRAMSRLKRLIQEIHRRSLWQVLGIYVGGAWVALQGIEALVSVLGLPGWVPGFALVVLILGLPIVLATAFVQEGVGVGGEPAEAEETSEPADEGGLHLVLTWRNVVLGGVVVVALAGVGVAGWFLLGGGISRSPETIRSIAVLPLENLTGDPGQEYFADGMTEAVISEFARLGALSVISRTSVMRYKQSDKSLPEIAQELGVEGVVEGSVFRAGDRVCITLQLIDARNDLHLWAETYERDSSAVGGRSQALLGCRNRSRCFPCASQPLRTCWRKRSCPSMGVMSNPYGEARDGPFRRRGEARWRSQIGIPA